MLEAIGAVTLLALAWLVVARLGEIRDALRTLVELEVDDDEDDGDDPDDGEKVTPLKAVGG